MARLEAILKQGANVDAKDDHGLTPDVLRRGRLTLIL
jgi:hypothetical protein